MSEYQLTSGTDVVRTADMAVIPADPANADYQVYQAWLDDGGVPDPYVPPEPEPPSVSGANAVLYDHENRIRALEGQPAMTLADLLAKVRRRETGL